MLARLDDRLVDYTLTSSVFNGQSGSLAVDGLRDTYTETGRERGAWWGVKLRQPVDVSSVTIDGQFLRRRFDALAGRH